MEPNAEPEHCLTIEHNVPQSMQIDPKRARFPCCIVWTPLPVISWFIPFIGHMGICREDGVILDFAGPNFVCVDNFTFGEVARYIQISKAKCRISSHSAVCEGKEEYGLVKGGSSLTWDDALRKSTQEYQHHSYNILTCNCHSFVANNLNRLEYRAGGWNMVNLATLIFLKGHWLSTASLVRSNLPFLSVFVLGLTFGGASFLAFWGFFVFVLVGWFLLGTYCFENAIQL